jgi:hypothetical protein
MLKYDKEMATTNVQAPRVRVAVLYVPALEPQQLTKDCSAPLLIFMMNNDDMIKIILLLY